MYKINKELKIVLEESIERLKERESLADNVEVKAYLLGKLEAYKDIIRWCMVEVE